MIHEEYMYTDAVCNAARRSRQVLSRLIAPCPQCHTLGDDPNCKSLTHVIHNNYPDAYNDIVEARRDLEFSLNRLDKAYQR